MMLRVCASCALSCSYSGAPRSASVPLRASSRSQLIAAAINCACCNRPSRIRRSNRWAVHQRCAALNPTSARKTAVSQTLLLPALLDPSPMLRFPRSQQPDAFRSMLPYEWELYMPSIRSGTVPSTRRCIKKIIRGPSRCQRKSAAGPNAPGLCATVFCAEGPGILQYSRHNSKVMDGPWPPAKGTEEDADNASTGFRRA